MKLLFFIILVLFGAISLGLITMENPGYVLIAREPWSIEMSLTVFVILQLVGIVALYLLLHMLVRLWNTPREVARWRTGRRSRRARASLVQAMIGLAENNWLEAEKSALIEVHSGEFPLANYLLAISWFASKQNGGYLTDRTGSIGQRHVDAIHEVWIDIERGNRMGLARNVFIFIDRFSRRLIHTETNNDAMDSRFPAGFIAPFEGAVGEMNTDALCQQPAP